MPSSSAPRQPKYRRHKRSGRAVVTLNFPGGKRKDVPLGVFESPASYVKYHQVIAQWSAGDQHPLPLAASITIAELILRFWEGHVLTYYRHADGTPTSEQENYRQALRSLRAMHEDDPASDFDPPRLETWLHAVTRPTRMIVDPDTHKTRDVAGWSRTNANKHLSRIKQLFKWAVRKNLVGANVYTALLTVPGLKYLRCDARETEPVKPVAEEFVAAIKGHVSDEVAAMARLQIYCGARGGELCAMRWADIETGGAVWFFRPPEHKTAYRGHVREVPLGPECQKILKDFKKLDLQARIFAPYTTTSYRRSIARACEKLSGSVPAHLARMQLPRLNRPKFWRWETPAEHEKRLGPDRWRELKAWKKAHRFTPHRTRHTAATRFRKQHGLQGAQVMLGHKHPKVTEIYAETSSDLAMRIAAEMG